MKNKTTYYIEKEYSQMSIHFIDAVCFLLLIVLLTWNLFVIDFENILWMFNGGALVAVVVFAWIHIGKNPPFKKIKKKVPIFKEVIK